MEFRFMVDDREQVIEAESEAEAWEKVKSLLKWNDGWRLDEISGGEYRRWSLSPFALKVVLKRNGHSRGRAKYFLLNRVK